MASETSETDQAIRRRNRRHNGNRFLIVLLTTLRFISFLINTAGFALLIRYCVFQRRNGFNGPVIIATIGIGGAWCNDATEFKTLLGVKKLGQLNPGTTAFSDIVTLVTSVVGAATISTADEKAADNARVDSYNGLTDSDRQAASALLATNAGFRVIFLCIGFCIWRGQKRFRARWRQAGGGSDERPWSNTAAADGAGVGMEDTAIASVVPMGVHEPAIIHSTTPPSQTSQPSGMGPGQIAYTTSPAPIPLHGVSPDVDLPDHQADMAPPARETQRATPLRSRRRHCGNFIMFLRLISVLVSLATFAILIRYCVAQYKHGSMGGGVLGSLGAVIASFIDWEQVGQLRHTRDKIGRLVPNSTSFLDAVALGFSVGSAVVIFRFEQKAADKVDEYGGPTYIDRRAATALIATVAGFRVVFLIFGGFVETGRFIARRRGIRRDREAERRAGEAALMTPGRNETVVGETSVNPVIAPIPAVVNTANNSRETGIGIEEASGPGSGTVAGTDAAYAKSAGRQRGFSYLKKAPFQD
ncbi:hypothetical protein V500_08097 [Pseudogymnoascus sp. VKM F-4518 (FW-2643)]|nr:hypothetical protein V500_08097 [Pseudogymnoascus sp. VKM F-4518 (FW-2643)]